MQNNESKPITNKPFSSYSTLLECNHCGNKYKNRNDCLAHAMKCKDPQAKEKFDIINGQSNLETFIMNLELKYNATLNKTTKSHKELVFYCNFKQNSKYTCPMTIIIKLYNKDKYYISNNFLVHNHSIDFNQLHLSKKEITRIKAMIEDNMSKEEILYIVNHEFLSPKAPFVGIEFINNLISKSFNNSVSKNKVETFLSHYNQLKNKNLLNEFCFKPPGETIDNLEYPGCELLICFNFKEQDNFIRNHDFKYMLADTTSLRIGKNYYYQYFFL